MCTCASDLSCWRPRFLLSTITRPWKFNRRQLAQMCFQIVEFYAACRCLYYQHPIDQCGSFGSPGHEIRQRTTFVGYTCSSHPVIKAATSHEAFLEPKKHRIRIFGTLAVSSNYAEGVEDEAAQDPGFYNNKDNPLHYNGGEEKEQPANYQGEDNVVDAAASYTSDYLSSGSSQELSSISSLAELQVQPLIETFFKDMLGHPVLCYFWPQVMRSSGSRATATLSIQRLLHRYANDLRRGATTRLQQDAARLVKWARLETAQRLAEAHTIESPAEESLQEQRLAEGYSKSHLGYDEELELVGTDDDEIDVTIKYEAVRSFLFESEAFEMFQSNLKDFVRFNKPSIIPKSGYEQAITYLGQQMERYILQHLKPPVQPHQTRVQWTCHCGHTSFDDVVPPAGYSACNLERFLASYATSDAILPRGTPAKAATSSQTTDSANSRPGFAGAVIASISRIFTTARLKFTLPRYIQDTGDKMF
ncbi:hypothetical protein NLU13_5176 [Sarocladium strictum]|uniref:Uncharacterized protein n=1 Tax=Sarocladium strictum TaxID=5046 RepID=A0AA39GHN9_SARSR|nr:hypothetical protein NLU13_5176 [Sarocladium strictum]